MKTYEKLMKTDEKSIPDPHPDPDPDPDPDPQPDPDPKSIPDPDPDLLSTWCRPGLGP